VENSEIESIKSLVISYGFKYINEPKTGLGRARATGIKSCCGDLIASTDADCILDKNWLKEIKSQFNRNPNIGVVAGVIPKLDKDGFVKKYQRTLAMNGLEDKQYLSYICPYPFAIGANAIYKRQVLIDAGSFDIALDSGSDVDASWKIQEKGYILVVNSQVIVNHSCRKSLKDVFNQFYKYALGHTLLFKKYRKKYHKIIGFNFYPKIGLIKCITFKVPIGILLLCIGRKQYLYKTFFEVLEYLGLSLGLIVGAIRNKVFIV
jgi:GT2 family glycosyltransferase